MNSAPPRGAHTPVLSVVIPSYNSAPWLPSTLEALASAIDAASAAVEVIIVDDGSTDETVEIVTALSASYSAPVRLMRQANRGRFLARWEGIAAATADTILLLDSRVLIHPDSLRHALASIVEEPSLRAWNAFVVTDERAPLVGLFWEVPTHVFWGRFLRSPRTITLTAANFDSAPKGTTMFLARKEVLVDAFQAAWPNGETKLVSDDTKVLRRIADVEGIRLDPDFSATYRPRTTLRGFVRHTFDRGTLFVDSYAGTTLVRSAALIAMVVLPVAGVVALALLLWKGVTAVAGTLIGVSVLAVVVPAIIAAVNRCSRRGLAAYLVCLPIFTIPFWAGLVRGLAIHRKNFSSSARQREARTSETELQ